MEITSDQHGRSSQPRTTITSLYEPLPTTTQKAGFPPEFLYTLVSSVHSTFSDSISILRSTAFYDSRLCFGGGKAIYTNHQSLAWLGSGSRGKTGATSSVRPHLNLRHRTLYIPIVTFLGPRWIENCWGFLLDLFLFIEVLSLVKTINNPRFEAITCDDNPRSPYGTHTLI